MYFSALLIISVLKASNVNVYGSRLVISAASPGSSKLVPSQKEKSLVLFSSLNLDSKIWKYIEWTLTFFRQSMNSLKSQAVYGVGIMKILKHL